MDGLMDLPRLWCDVQNTLKPELCIQLCTAMYELARESKQINQSINNKARYRILADSI
jgi:hypothetical protein